MAGSPLDQFKLKTILEFKPFGLDLSINNGTIMMFVVLASLIGFLYFITRRLSVKPEGTSQIIAEGFYNFINSMIKGNITSKRRIIFFPFVFSLFMFILFSNVLGIIPYSFTITSHISITFAMAISVFLIVVVSGIKTKGLKGYFLSFVPEGIPMILAPLIFIIEFITYLLRPFTLAIRLAANMIAGHTILKVMAGFVGVMGFFGVVPILFISVLMGFELFVACLQAYIFTMLTCIYLNEALSLHH